MWPTWHAPGDMRAKTGSVTRHPVLELKEYRDVGLFGRTSRPRGVLPNATTQCRHARSVAMSFSELTPSGRVGVDIYRSSRFVRSVRVITYK